MYEATHCWRDVRSVRVAGQISFTCGVTLYFALHTHFGVVGRQTSICAIISTHVWRGALCASALEGKCTHGVCWCWCMIMCICSCIRTSVCVCVCVRCWCSMTWTTQF